MTKRRGKGRAGRPKRNPHALWNTGYLFGEGKLWKTWAMVSVIYWPNKYLKNVKDFFYFTLPNGIIYAYTPRTIKD